MKPANLISLLIVILLVTVPLAVAGTVTRTLSPATSVQGGTILEVTLTVTTASNEDTFIINEYYPPTWMIVSKADAFLLNDGNPYLKFVESNTLPSSTSTKIYTINIPSSATTGTFSGNFLFTTDFSATPITPSTITVSPVSCTDGVMNGQETDVDCGGPTCSGCTDGKICSLAVDCTSNVCTSNRCQPIVSCTDSIQNQDETGVDCGGTICDACETLTCGNADGSAGIDTKDVLAVVKHIFESQLLTGNSFTAADVDGVGGVNQVDVLRIVDKIISPDTNLICGIQSVGI
jgi:hypothetical protein